MASIDAFTLLSWLGSTLFALALLPQFVRTRRLGHANDLSIAFLLTVLAASLCTGLWALSLGTLGGYGVTASQTVNLIIWGYILDVRLRPRSGYADAATRPQP